MEVEAEQFKEQGNKLFSQAKFEDASNIYTKAIEKLCTGPKASVYYCNRAFCYIKLENFGSAIRDAEESMKQNPTYIKPYYRRAVALFSLNKIDPAVADFKRVVQICPTDTDAVKRYDEAVKEQKWRKLGEALGYEDDIKDIKLEDYKIESTYQGPMLENTDSITLEWVTKLIDYLQSEKVLHKRIVLMMIIKLRELLSKMPTLTDLSFGTDFTIVGDVHGQFYDMLNIFKLNGLPSKTNPYIFNGDFVDRGSFSVEVIVTLMAFKLLCPEHVYLNRGNHETKSMNSLYGFKGEVKAKYDEKTYSIFSDMCQKLPISYVINKKVMVMHGGLFSKDDVTLADVNKVNRFTEPVESGIMCERLWSNFVN
jgi:serine/threonine-protein phosphatase 5